VVLIFLCAVLALIAQESGTTKTIVVELSAKKTIVYPGEMLKLHVTIKNLGNRALFIPRDISAINQRFVLSMRPSKGQEQGSMAVGDTFYAPGQTPPFANLLSMEWLALAPGMFYGCDMDVYASEFRQLKVPGKYTITGHYASHGFNENLLGFEEDTGKLPFKAWKGEVDTNPLTILVTRRAAK
jgi:hypothetical protein